MTPEELKKIARDERAYRYACQLLGDGRVKNLRVDGEHSFSATIEDMPYAYTASVTLAGDGLSACSCTCGMPVASRRVCAHVGALCLELSREGRTQVLLSRARREAGLQVLSWFETPAAREQSLKLLVTVEIPEKPGEAAGFLSLRVGQKRMYVVQDLSTFVKAYTAGEDIAFGKGLTVEPHWQCFGPAQERLLAYLREVVAARELALGKPVLRERQLPLTNDQLRRVFQMLAQSVFQLVVGGGNQHHPRHPGGQRAGVLHAARGGQGAGAGEPSAARVREADARGAVRTDGGPRDGAFRSAAEGADPVPQQRGRLALPVHAARGRAAGVGGAAAAA